MTLSAFGVSIEIPEPSFPYIRPHRPSQSRQTSGGGAIYTTKHAEISPQVLNLIVQDLTSAEQGALDDFILNVIEFSSYPCTITTEVDTHENMHLTSGWDTITDRRGDIANARLQFLESEDGVVIGKNLLEVPRFFTSAGALSPQWATTGAHTSPVLDADDSPFGYAQRIFRVAAAATISLSPVQALPLVGTDIKIGYTYRRPPAHLSVLFVATATENAVTISEITAHNEPAADPTGDWVTISGDIAESQVPVGANFFVPKFTAGAGSVTDLAQITCEYML